jgi:hypothetical protein
VGTDPKRTIQTTVFDNSDGVSSHSLALYSPRVAKSSDGKIWYLTLDGVSVIDPRDIEIHFTALNLAATEKSAFATSWKAWIAIGGTRVIACKRSIQIFFPATTASA